jgi:predicted ribosome quality control (RQC) complex YloA/Tae2 family protein
MLLRKELTGARVSGCRAVPGERACELVFARPDGDRKLLLFLFGRSAQLVLVSGDRALGAIGPAREVRTALPPPREDTSQNRFGDAPGISARIAAHYAEAGDAADLQDEAARAEAARRAELVRLRRLERALGGDRARAEDAQSHRKLGDLLLAHLAEVPRGASQVTLPDDFAGGAPVEIKLDPARSARENAERYYQSHKRLSRALETIDARIAEVQREIAALEAGGLPRPRTASGARRRGGEAPALPYREYLSSAGVPILVGRGAAKNDELTFKVARGSDLWLHTRDVPGAHVIVTLSPGKPVDPDTLVDAATLAAHHSNARDEAQVDVGYTLRKHVRKPPKSKPGTVLTAQLKTIRVRMEPARLKRLLDSGHGKGGNA